MDVENWIDAQENINKNNNHNITFLKTHSAIASINGNPFTTNKQTIAAIYIIRDPRNVVTSMSNHYEMDFENTVNFMINKKKFLMNKKKLDSYGNLLNEDSVTNVSVTSIDDTGMFVNIPLSEIIINGVRVSESGF